MMRYKAQEHPELPWKYRWLWYNNLLRYAGFPPDYNWPSDVTRHTKLVKYIIEKVRVPRVGTRYAAALCEKLAQGRDKRGIPDATLVMILSVFRLVPEFYEMLDHVPSGHLFPESSLRAMFPQLTDEQWAQITAGCDVVHDVNGERLLPIAITRDIYAALISPEEDEEE